MSRKFAFILHTFNYYINMVYLYYLKFKVVSSSKDALIVNNMYGYCENYEVFSYSLQKIMYCIYNGKFYSHAVIINSLVI